MTMDGVDSIIIFLSLIIPLLGVFFLCLTDRFVNFKRKKIYILLVVFVASLIAQNFFEYYLIEYVINVKARTIVSAYGYMVRPVIIALFIYLVSPEKKHIPASILMGINILMYTTAFYSRLTVSFTDDNHFVGGPLRYT